MPPRELAARGLLNAEVDYPYRDDALRLWDATLEWTTSFVDAYYVDDAAVIGDEALQNFAQELVSEDGGRYLCFLNIHSNAQFKHLKFN